MCGVAGFSLNPNEKVNAKRLSKAMLLDIESRGRDATGFAFMDSTGAIQIHKRDLPATIFVRGRLCMPKKCSTVIMHTRFATQGSEQINENNHPIWQAGVVGVHNGHVLNDDALFDDIAKVAGGDVRIAQVDSEAIFAAIGWGQYDDVTKVLESIQGNATVAWLDEDDPQPNRLHLARIDTSPLVLGQTKGGSVLFASTQSAVEAGAKAVGLELAAIRHIAEGNYLQVLEGEVLDVQTFAVPTRRYTRSYTTTPKSYWTPSDYESWEDYDLHDYMAAHRTERKEWTGMGTTVIGGTRELAKVTNLTDRVNAEEPDVFDDATSPDEDDELYQRWLQENAIVIDHKLAIEAQQDKEHARFAEYLRAPKISTYMVAHAEYPVPVPSEANYLEVTAHVNREWAIETWFNGVKADEETKTNAALALRADVRPGYHVKTMMHGRLYDGHVVEVPETYPQGEYIIRLFVPCDEAWKNKQYETEAVLVARQYWQFEVTESVEVK